MGRGRKDKPVQMQGEEKQAVGAMMRLARQQKGITLTVMAQETGYSKSYLSTVENGIALPSTELVAAYESNLGLERGKLAEILKRQREEAEESKEKQETEEVRVH